MRAACAAALALLVLLPSSAAADLNGVEGHVGHAGRWFTDDQGRVLSFRGVVLPLRKAPYILTAHGFGADDAQFLADEGFNLVHARFVYSAVEPEPGRYDENYVDQFVALVRELTSRGVRVLVTSDQGNWGPVTHGRGFPDWATFTDGAPNPDLGFGANHLANVAMQRAFDHLWANKVTARGDSLQDGYARALAHVAARFADDPLVLGLNVMNEPWIGSRWPTCFPLGTLGVTAGCEAFDRDALAPFYSRVIPAIRAAMPRQIVMYEPVPTFDLGTPTFLRDVGAHDPRIGFSFHPYCSQDGGGVGLPPLPLDDVRDVECTLEETRVVEQAIAHVERTGDALLSSEFGATQLAATTGRLVRMHERHLVPWTITAWCCRDFSGAPSGDLIIDPRKPPTPDNMRQDKLHHLVRPYPAALSGVPAESSFDPDAGTYRLRFRTERASGNGSFGAGSESIVHVPRRHYPRGYAIASVDGARVASQPDADRLVLVGEDGAETVELELRPRRTGDRPPVCHDARGPRPRLRRASLSPRRLALAGSASDAGCLGSGGAFGLPGRVERVDVSIARQNGRRCQFVDRDGLLGRRRDCGRRLYLLAEGSRRWSLQRAVRVPPGRYVLSVRASDGRDNVRTLRRVLRAR